MKSIVTVVGARPQFIKAAPLSRAIAANGTFEEAIVHTGQHFDANMSDVFFEELGIAKPARFLGISGGTHGAMTGAMLAALEQAFLELKPDTVVVYGDTNSTLAGALAASKMHIPIVHVEAGLRSFNRRMPEEQNRVLTDHLADLLFVPSAAAARNLAREGLPAERVHDVGDVMFDAIRQFGQRARSVSSVLARLALSEGQYVLSTVHRAENTDDPARLLTIIDALEMVARTLPVVLPLHPRARAALDRAGRWPDRIRVVEPVGYLDMIRLEGAAAVIATDSGGVQKEAYFQGVPCVTLRDETEWVELLDCGWNTLAPPTDTVAVAQAILAARERRGEGDSLYGHGNAAPEIVSILSQHIR
ncbi:UDP-N-acetylglucosamine 2-epimerase (non-hydrolyzing) [Devosia sp. ZB163]|uniref:non-hydrolyzing UDP-N-acetylglucosamine 2-epimerase n=1 Tax=Devosia sp. ZB163 TaxID=3025938 RepID=UPI00235F1DC5|nr:UDP-N-acetylglucosamine 2-epimerase (non-hydrolyzing) [Devosia sp. ZB163]MDC9823043.1 UDP-N-acetylglucosamine 2-epimerase (non-hydrolyzing) [Devosia sp. ZB163]